MEFEEKTIIKITLFDFFHKEIRREKIQNRNVNKKFWMLKPKFSTKPNSNVQKNN